MVPYKQTQTDGQLVKVLWNGGLSQSKAEEGRREERGERRGEKGRAGQGRAGRQF